MNNKLHILSCIHLCYTVEVSEKTKNFKLYCIFAGKKKTSKLKTVQSSQNEDGYRLTVNFIYSQASISIQPLICYFSLDKHTTSGFLHVKQLKK